MQKNTENHAGERYVPTFNERADFALTVRGNKLAPFIKDGDVVLIEKGTDFLDGDFAVVELHEEYTLSMAYHYNGGLLLDNFSCDYPQMVFSQEELQDGTVAVRGLLVGFLRP